MWLGNLSNKKSINKTNKNDYLNICSDRFTYILEIRNNHLSKIYSILNIITKLLTTYDNRTRSLSFINALRDRNT